MAHMTNNDYITPMAQRSIYFIVYPGFELLDLSGPMAVFSAANTLAASVLLGKAVADTTEQDNFQVENSQVDNELTNNLLYQTKTLSSSGGLVASSAGVAVQTERLSEFQCNSSTTFLIVGAHGSALKQANQDKVLCSWLAAQSVLAERFGSVCSGAFVLHAAGILADKTVTTHWAGCGYLQTLKSKQSVLQDALYHIDGKCWTSAGVTTGIDMALEMLKRDHGQQLMLTVAKYLVVYSQRPGTQSQFAVVQEMKPNQADAFANLINWLKKEILRPIKVGEMADFMCMSERSFQRRFSEQFSTSPSRFYERMRMEYARDFLLPRHAVEVAANMLGYSSVAAFRTGFKKHFGISPSIGKQIR